jgi:hypothetical protein
LCQEPSEMDLQNVSIPLRFDFPLPELYKALCSPPLPLYTCQSVVYKRSHFIIPLIGHAERNQEAAKRRRSQVEDDEKLILLLELFKAVQHPVPLPSIEVIQDVHKRVARNFLTRNQELLKWIQEPVSSAYTTLVMPFIMHQNLSYHGYYPLFNEIAKHSSSMHSIAQVLLFTKKEMQALYLESFPQIPTAYSADLFQRPYFGVSRLTDGHLHRTAATEAPILPRPIPSHHDFRLHERHFPIPENYIEAVFDESQRCLGHNFMPENTLKPEKTSLPSLKDLLQPMKPELDLDLHHERPNLAHLFKAAEINPSFASKKTRSVILREKNRIAANKSRLKKKRELNQAQQDIFTMENASIKNSLLLDKFILERTALLDKIDRHSQCPCSYSFSQLKNLAVLQPK